MNKKMRHGLEMLYLFPSSYKALKASIVVRFILPTNDDAVAMVRPMRFCKQLVVVASRIY